MNEHLSGSIEKILFQSPENGFTVFVLRTSSTNTVTVKGSFASLHAGEHVTLQGAWIVHPKFGKQFDARDCTTSTPTSIIGLKKYLGSGLIKGIGPVYAEKLVDYFGLDVLEVIDQNPERLKEVSGIGQKRIATIIDAWKDQKEIANVMLFLQEKNISPAYATKIYKKYGQESIAVLNENPYRLADELWGVGFKLADQIAQNLGFTTTSPKRIKAGITFAITTQIGYGNLYIELSKLKKTTVELLEINEQETAHLVKHALHDLYNEDKIKLITHNNEHFVTLSHYYFSEKGFAQKLITLNEYPSNITFDLDTIYQKLRVHKPGDINLNEEQQKSILNCLQNKVSIITGGPGTGKTTLIKKLLLVLDAQRVSYKLAAPTGRAAKRIQEGTGKHAMTLHRLLEYDFMTRSFVHNENNALKLDFLIVDEASMIDVFLAYAVAKAVPHNAHLIFIGDKDQLPSVGPGNILNDLIASGKIATVKLEQVFRQEQDSLIVVNAHKINHGEFPTSYLPEAKRDFIFIKEDNVENIPHHLETIYNKGLRKFGIQKKDSIVLTPMNRGGAGTHKLNHDLQQLLNPHESEKKVSYAGNTFKINDRVMQIKNNYDKTVFNGDIGVIEAIDMTEKVVAVRFIERLVEYDFTEMSELVLAYAISIHKSQGSEYPAVIIPIFMQHFMLLQRNLVYTAITRAKKFCIFIGQAKAIAMAIKNTKGNQRKTFLQEFLTTDLACRS